MGMYAISESKSIELIGLICFKSNESIEQFILLKFVRLIQYIFIIFAIQIHLVMTSKESTEILVRSDLAGTGFSRLTIFR